MLNRYFLAIYSNDLLIIDQRILSINFNLKIFILHEATDIQTMKILNV